MLWRRKKKTAGSPPEERAPEGASPGPTPGVTPEEIKAAPKPAKKTDGNAEPPKHPKPKIFLLDMPRDCAETLRRAGYNVTVGSFGTPYTVKPSDSLYPVSFASCRLPDYEEQEIIVANTRDPEPEDAAPKGAPGHGVDASWQSCKAGVINPRPLVMGIVRNAFENIETHGGIFIIFASGERPIEYCYGSVNEYGSFDEKERLVRTNWSFLGDLVRLKTSSRHGQEIEFDPEVRDFTALLKRGSEGARYECTLQPSYNQKDNWSPLAKNKYGNDVAGMLIYDDPKRYVLVLPQMPNAHKILLELLEHWCAEWNPALFPHIEGAGWVHRPAYEIPRVLQIQRHIEEVRQDTKKKVEELEDQIKSLREENKDTYILLRGTGDSLVQAVIRSLQKVGFENVVDVDQQAHDEGRHAALREDIQVHDGSPILVIDVKGVRGRPDDDESRQAEKHAQMRMREWDRTDVQPLTIINHERHLPPHDRDPKAYRQEIIDNARDTGLGLMTTWDLFKVLRNKEALGWPPEVVLPIFYQNGRSDPVPAHYREIGKIVKVWQKAFGVIPSEPIPAGATLAIEVGDTFEELVAESLQVDDQAVHEAPSRSDCGVGCANAADRFGEGMRVFLVLGYKDAV